MLLHKFDQPGVDLIPHFIGRDRPKRAGRHFDCYIESAAMTDVYDDRIVSSDTGQEVGNRFDRLLGSRKTDPHRPRSNECIQTLQRERQVGASFVIGHSVNLVHDNRLDVSQDIAALLGRQEDVERFGSGHQNVRWTL